MRDPEDVCGCGCNVEGHVLSAMVVYDGCVWSVHSWRHARAEAVTYTYTLARGSDRREGVLHTDVRAATVVDMADDLLRGAA